MERGGLDKYLVIVNVTKSNIKSLMFLNIYRFAIYGFILEQAEHTTYGQSPGLEWRYSFSQAEMILSDNIPAPARSAYLSFKAINKRHLNMKGREMGSYALKCILLSVVESKNAQFWEGMHGDIAVQTLM